MSYWDFMGSGSVRLQVNGEWIDYTGTTSLRKLYYRALEAQRAGNKSFFVHDFPRRSVTGIRLKPGFHQHLSCVAINGVAAKDLPCEVDLTPPAPKIRVFDGSLVNPYDVKPEDMKPLTFIHSISCLTRFHGHAAYPYSVGQHSRNLTLLVPDELKRVALLHDFSEALFNDLASPVKRQNHEYKEAEHEAMIRIFNHFGVGSDEYIAFDEYDKRIYINERDALFVNKVGELGMNDDLQPLNTSQLPHIFKEVSWRKVRGDLILLWLTLLPEFDLITGDYIHGNH